MAPRRHACPECDASECRTGGSGLPCQPPLPTWLMAVFHLQVTITNITTTTHAHVTTSSISLGRPRSPRDSCCALTGSGITHGLTSLGITRHFDMPVLLRQRRGRGPGSRQRNPPPLGGLQWRSAGSGQAPSLNSLTSLQRRRSPRTTASCSRWPFSSEWRSRSSVPSRPPPSSTELPPDAMYLVCAVCVVS